MHKSIMGFKHQITSLQGLQNFEVMCTQTANNNQHKIRDSEQAQPMQVTDFSISRILSEEKCNNKNNNVKSAVKNFNANRNINKQFETSSDILDLSKHATPQEFPATEQQLQATASFNNYTYNCFGPINFLAATKFYAQFLPHMLPNAYNIPRVNATSVNHLNFPSATILPIATNSPILPHFATPTTVLQQQKVQRIFAPYVLKPGSLAKWNTNTPAHHSIPYTSKAYSPDNLNKRSANLGPSACSRVNCADCLRDYYHQISNKINSNQRLAISVGEHKNLNNLKDVSDGQVNAAALTTISNMNLTSAVGNQITKFNASDTNNKAYSVTNLAEEISYKCFICDKVFGCSQTLQAHEKTHKSPRYECADCGKGFSQLRNYKYHLSVHRGTKEFAAECPECGKTFNDKGYLSSHMKIHRNKKEYECPYCPKSFNQRVAFNMHVRIHTGVKPHKCVECGKRFSRKMLLKQHMRTHSGEKPYQCSVCGKSFADRSNMTLHHRLHSGIKPFSCPICPKAFTKKHHLKTHLNYHTGCKPYVCPHPNCNQAFTQSSNMRTHAKKCQYRPLELNSYPVATNATISAPATTTAATTTNANPLCLGISTSGATTTTNAIPAITASMLYPGTVQQPLITTLRPF